MSTKSSKMPLTIAIVFTAVLFTVCLSATVLLAAINIARSLDAGTVGGVGELNSTVNSGSISVTNDMDCVMRVLPLASGVTFGASYWVRQDNGWYYYNRIIKADDANKTVALTGATSSNVLVELMQAQYSTDAHGDPNGGFIVEWASRDMFISGASTLGQYTTDGLNILKKYNTNSTIVMFSGHDEDRRMPPSTGGDENHFQATRVNNYYVFNKVSITGESVDMEAITSSNAITLYNNSQTRTVFTIQIINGGHAPNKSSTFSNGNWTTYVDEDTSDSTNKWKLASESSATTGYNTYFVSKPVDPGEYVDLTNGSDNQLIFDTELNEATTPLRFTISSIDTMTFYHTYLGNPNSDAYLAWLNALDQNSAGATSYYADFAKLLSAD